MNNETGVLRSDDFSNSVQETNRKEDESPVAKAISSLSGTEAHARLGSAGFARSSDEVLLKGLKGAGISVWHDKDSMSWRDDLRTSIDRGLANSRYGIVVF